MACAEHAGHFPLYLFNPVTPSYLLYGEVCDCVGVWGVTENKDSIRGEEIIFGNMASVFGTCWVWLEETVRRCQREIIERDTPSTLMSGWLAGPWCRHFASGFFSQGFSKSLNVLYVIVRVCSPSVTAWMFAKQNSKSSHLIPSLSTHRAKTTLGPSVLCFDRYHPRQYGKLCKGGCFICLRMCTDWIFKITWDITLKFRAREQKKTLKAIFATSNIKHRAFLAEHLAHQWLQQIRLFPLRS